MMWRLLSLILLTGAFAFAQDVKPPAGSEKIIMKTIELDWDTVPGAVAYEVRLTPNAGGKALVFAAKENKLSQDVPIGPYKLQIRSKGKEGEFSAWSPATEFDVAVKETFPLFPDDGAEIDSKGSDRQLIEFKWTPVPKVKEYTLKVWNEEREASPWVFKGTTTSKRIEVPPGRTYYWQVLFQSADDVTYLQNPKTFSFTLQGTRLLKPEIAAKQTAHILTWKAVSGAKTYKVKLSYRHLDEKEWKVVKEDDVDGAFWNFEKLPAGDYQLEVTSEAPHRGSSDPATREFFIKPTADELSLALRTAAQ